MNSQYETPDRDIARVMKKESHENTRRDRKQFRNIANELRYAESSEDLDDLDVDTFERFRRRWKNTVNILLRVTIHRPESRILTIPNSHVNRVANPILRNSTIRMKSRESVYTIRECCRFRIHIVDVSYAATMRFCIAQRVMDIRSFIWDCKKKKSHLIFDFIREKGWYRKLPG